MCMSMEFTFIHKKIDMPKKKIVQRALPLDQKYEILSVYRGDFLSGNITTCQNCGKPISNIAEVKNSAGTTFHVGIDCAKTLSLVNPLDFEGYDYTFKQVVKFIKLAKKEKSIVTNDGFRAVVQYIHHSNKWGEFTDAFDVFEDWMDRHSPGWKQLLTNNTDNNE